MTFTHLHFVRHVRTRHLPPSYPSSDDYLKFKLKVSNNCNANLGKFSYMSFPETCSTGEKLKKF